jgi:hypothetical protein
MDLATLIPLKNDKQRGKELICDIILQVFNQDMYHSNG